MKRPIGTKQVFIFLFAAAAAGLLACAAGQASHSQTAPDDAGARKAFWKPRPSCSTPAASTAIPRGTPRPSATTCSPTNSTSSAARRGKESPR